MVKKCLRWLLMASYAILMIFGFLSGMLSEGLIGSAHPMAGMLADAMTWLGLGVSLTAAAGLLAMLGLKAKPRMRRVVMALPFLLLAVQMILSAVAEGL